MTSPKDAALRAGALYACNLLLRSDPATTASPDTGGAVNLSLVTLTFTWPAEAAVPPQRYVLNAALARH